MTTDIYRLLDKYFEGDSSVEEEKMLRRYFAQDDIPEELEVYTSLFRFLEDESTALAILNEIKQEENVQSRRSSFLVRKIKVFSAVAAVLLIAVLLLVRPGKQSASVTESYVWVDGEKITDPVTVREYAESSFEKVQPESDIIEDQLRYILE